MTAQTLTIEDALQSVLEARAQYRQVKEQVDTLRQEFTSQHAALLDEETVRKQDMHTAEETLRTLAVETYRQTGSKTIAPGVGIREMTRLQYDSECALAWAIEHRIALALDAKTFEKLAPVLNLRFVAACTEPQATLAQYLRG